MSLVLSYDHHEGLARAILTRDGVPQECFFDRLARPQQTGAIYRGVVDRVGHRGRGAFIRLDASGACGFLNDAEGLNAGDTLLVQIKSEARGAKGPGLTRWISLPGLYVIYQPFDEDGVHFSRRLDEAAQARAEHAASGLDKHAGGWVIRRAALNATPDAIAQEAQELVQAAQALRAGGPAGLALKAPNAFEQAVLGHAGEGLRVMAEAALDLNAACGYLRAARPGLVAQLDIEQAARVFDRFDLESFFAQLCRQDVPMPRGGHLLFEVGETLNAIDVNAGTRTHFFEVNEEAAHILMQQLRWRNIGGLVVVDFLRMKQPDDRHTLADHVRELAAHDASPCDIYGFTRMGLFEISRARRGFSLAELMKGEGI